MTDFLESAEIFDCRGSRLMGVLHDTENTGGAGVVLVVGGPQYRVGSHRMFVDIARQLAAAGFPTLRYDFRGMGDSEGVFQGFERLDDDVEAAVTHMLRRRSDLSSVVLLGLCDGATAAALYAPGDSRVRGQVLLNPWVHSEVGNAKAYLWYYYPRRLLQRDFWRGLFAGDVNVAGSLADFLGKARRVFGGSDAQSDPLSGSFLSRMLRALGDFPGQTLFVTSENDLTAVEFKNLVAADGQWARIVRKAELVDLPGADHTLSEPDDLSLFVKTVTDWLSGNDEKTGA